MAEELKHLIDQIQKEGLDKANEQADAILSQAKEKAAKLIADAEAKAAGILEKTKQESEAFAARSVKTLEQAARDLMITVGQGCAEVAAAVLGKEINTALSSDFLPLLIQKVVEDSDGDLTLSVSEDDKAALIDFCAEQAQKSGREFELVSDSEVLSGFKVGFKNKNVYLDYTGETIAETLSSFLRPELAKTVSTVAREKTNA